MNKTTRHRVAILLLLVYVPVLLTMDLWHNHVIVLPGVTAEVAASTVAKGVTLSHDGFCASCLFATGHLFENVSPVLALSCQFSVVLSSQQPPLSPSNRLESARAPPSCLHS
ncbi:MAG: hypothetical protein KF749_10405 [Bacteroidetes bacterium]|nr:hypothetical protein [Bacteroidota bacterium]MCW5895823.1 hypothetical protein [Bacteroidota bacterium]